MTKVRMVFAVLAVVALLSILLLGKVDFGSDPAGNAMVYGGCTLGLLVLSAVFGGLAIFLRR
jgi:hypothetical protein